MYIVMVFSCQHENVGLVKISLLCLIAIILIYKFDRAAGCEAKE